MFMKAVLILFFLFISLTAIAQEIKTKEIIFTELSIDEVEGGYPFLSYKDDSGKEFSDLEFSGDIFVGDKILFYLDEYGTVAKLDKSYASQIIGKKIIMSYYLIKITPKSIPAFWQIIVTKLEFK